MGKRSINVSSYPPLIGPQDAEYIAKRIRRSSTKNLAALTLLALKQESLSLTSCVAQHDSKCLPLYRCESVSFDKRERSRSICSSVTDDEEREDVTDGVLKSSKSTLFSQPLLKMALTRPNLCLAVRTNHVLSSPTLIELPVGRPLLPPPRLPRHLVTASNVESLANAKAT